MKEFIPLLLYIKSLDPEPSVPKLNIFLSLFLELYFIAIAEAQSPNNDLSLISFLKLTLKQHHHTIINHFF